MGGLKKGKSSGKSKGKGKESRKEPKKVQDDHQRDSLLPLQERVAAVKPFWELLSQEERVKILTVSVEDVKERAADLAEQQRKQAVAEQQMYPEDTITIDLEPSIEELLEIGISRLEEKSAWKLWQWLADNKEFLDADSFRNYMETEHIEDSLRALLPKDEGKPVEKPAEAALRTRMSDLLQRVHQHNRQMQEEPYNGRRARAPRATPDQVGAAMRDTNIELINIMMEALEQEHEFLYHAVLFPITSCICEMLEEGSRESNCMDLCYEDLEKLHPDEVARICEWLTEKLDGFSSKIKPEAKEIEEEEEEEEGIGDVDLFTLSEDHQTLTVNAKWLQHLQERVLGTDGQPRKTKDGEDPFNMGLVLEWVFGTIVSTAEKARDGAKRTLGTRPPTATQAHDQLVQALREQQNWEKRAKDAKELLNRMLKSRKENADLAQQHDIKALAMRPAAGVDAVTAEPTELPDHVIVAMLHREILLTEAKLHALDYELVTSDRKLRQLRSQLRQGEPEFERLKRELEEVKNQPRGLEGTFRSAAEMERHRAQMADAAIEEQLEVQTAFREHGARLQGIYDKRQRTEMDIARKEQEIKQLKGWKTTVQSLIDRFDELTVSPLPPPGAADGEVGAPADESKGEPPADEAAAAHHQALEAATRSLTGHDMALAKLRSHFQKDVRRQLYGDDDDKTFFDWIRQELRSVEKGLEDGRAVLHHLEMFLVNVACNDPGAAIGAHLVLPLLQERLDAKALEFAAQRAAAAEEAIIKMEEEKAERARQEREKRQKMKQKAKDKVRTEKERMLAERDARLEAERAVLEETRRALLEKEEEVKKQKLEEIEKRRQEEEEQMEARRRELLSEEDGYWRRRMAQEVQTQALQEESIVKANPQAEEGPAESSVSDQSTWKDDNEGFRDTAKGPRRSRNLKQRPQPDVVTERPANGYSKPNGRIEDGRYPRQVREHEQPRENGLREQRRLPSVQDSRTLPVRELKPSRSSSTLSEKQSEKSRSGRTSPQLNELSNTRSVESTGSATLPLRPRAVPAEPAQQPGPKPTIAGRDPPQPASKQPVSPPLPGDETSPESTAALEPVKAAVPAVSAPAPGAALPSQVPAAVQAGAHQMEEPPAPISAAPPMLPDTQEAPQEQEPDASVPSSTASSNGPELAPGTPAQQPPPLPMLVPTPSVADGMPPPHHPGGGVIFMQGMHAQQPARTPAPHGMHQGQIGGAGMAPPSEGPHGVARNHPVRREGMHYTGPQNGPVPQGMMNGPVPLQPRRPQIAQARSTEPGMHPSQAYQRGFPRGSQQPPPPASGVQFPGQPMMGPPPGTASTDSAELPASGPPMIMHSGGPFMGQPGSGAPPAASGPPMMYPGQPHPPPPQGSQPMPQHVFVGNMVAPAFGMPSMGQIPIMNGPPGGPPNGHLQHSGDSPPHAGHMFPAFGGSPTRMGLRPAYGRGSPPPPVPGFQRQPGNTTLRANAPSFVPGGSSFRPSQPSHQPQLPRRPMSDQRRRSDDRGMYMGPGMSRPASSDMMHSSSGSLFPRNAETEPAPADAAARGMVPSLVQPAVPEARPQPPQEPAPEPDNSASTTENAAEPSSKALEAAQTDAQPAAAPASQPSGTSDCVPDAPPPGPHQQPQQPQQLQQPQQQPHEPEASSSDTAAAPQHILTRPQPVPPQKDSGASSSAQPPRPVASQLVAAPNINTNTASSAQQGPLKQQPKWSAVAAMDRQATHGQAGTSGGGGPLPLRKEGSGDVFRGSSPSARSEPSKRQASGSSSNLRKSGSGNQLGTARSSGSTRTAGDKRKVTRAGGVTWEGLQDEYDRLKLVRGLSNEAGRNNCFLNVIIQSLWHLRSFREALLAMQPQALEARGSPPEDVRVLRALWNIFNAFNQPREELGTADGSDGSSSPQTSGNGEEADAKRAKREGQEDAAAAKVSKGWTVSPAELREALSSISHAALRFDPTDMHDAAEVLDKIFSSLHRAEVGQPAEGELDAALPQRVRVPVPVPGAPPSTHQNGGSLPRRGPSSLVESLFGMDVQVPSPPDDEEDTLAVKRSKGTGGAVVGRWQETTARSGRPQGSSPKATAKPAGPKKPKDPSVVEMLQFIKLYHLVPAQGLKVAYDHLIGSQFEEVLKEADVAEQHLAQSAANGGLHQSVAGRVVKTSDIILLKRPRIFNLAIGWESAQAPADVINATIDALAPQVDPAGVFKSAPRGPGYQLRCIVCYFGHHYKAYALSEELNEWLLFDDSTISHIGDWRDVTASLRGSRLQPNLLFYEQQAA